ncbi:hypothetical protein ASPACDRAFT_45543 [Aspergillus aculeatus ATCC 16872]|uniref:Uncharacterized protein n=1 Tax=Aspergillus aculeatus (strain ATCC 16872 / CBS 172.66 / WB 5094) TaxID=690307 RepID=A0A1L9WMQ9_ASPA1|nr:uncharacterized protein ASPACDRAFT_45543 [Aspergillus aculeatus ATCC 16872]OJJ97453.1 hypothetical protein ASPACDRAFT_45543 [Aspergillus aculeatus ATCC 16872]
MAAPSERPEIIALSQDLRGTPQSEKYERMISGMMYGISPFSVAVGSPCRVRKTIQSPEEEEQDPNNPYRHLANTQCYLWFI